MASTISKNIEKVLNIAGNTALKHGRTTCNTASLFDAVLRFFAVEPELFKETSAKIKEITGRYGINGRNFNKALDAFYGGPSTLGELDPTTNTSLDQDGIDVLSNLDLKAQQERKTQDIDDFIAQLFSNKTEYALFNVFTLLSDMMEKDYNSAVASGVAQDQLPPTSFDVNLLYSDILTLFASLSVSTVKSLETPEMQKYLTNINKYVAEKKDFKFVGMEHEMKSLLIALEGRTKKSAVLVGPAGTGKTSLVYALADKINKKDEMLPENIQKAIIYELHMDALVAGSQFRGQFEERLKKILDAVSKLKNVILFMDEFHTIVTSGGTSGGESGGEQTGGNIMKPYLSRGDIWVIGATTNDEYNNHVQQDKAISRRFKQVFINEPTKDETIEIMKGVLPINCDYFNKIMLEDGLEKIYNLSTQYNMSSANPDKALTMLESAFAYSKVCEREHKEVTIDDLLKELEIEYQLNISKSKAEDTEKELKSFLLGQDKPLTKISDYLRMIDLNLVDPNKPKCALLFAGPTGTGKTETAKIIAKYYTGSESNLITVAGSTLQSETGVNAIFGSDPGYIGYKPTSDFLAQVKQKPSCVILFDEIEKANEAIFKSLLGMLDEGYVSDKAGNKISFKNAIIIFTTNLGYGKTNHNGSGMMSVISSSSTAENELNKHFSPEFIGRLDDIIIFNRLTSEVSNTLISRYVSKYSKQSEIDYKLSKKDYNEIKKAADVETLGARNLDHAVKKQCMKWYVSQKKKQSVSC